MAEPELRYIRLSARSKRAYAVYLENAEEAGASLPNLTTAEQLTGRTFLGTPTYQKTVVLPAGPNNETLVTAHGITGTIDDIVSLSGALWNAADDWIPLPHADATNIANQILLAVNRTGIVQISQADYSGFSGHATIEYTKV